MQTLSSRTQELNQLKSDWSAHTTTLSSEHTATLTTEREKALQLQTDIRSSHEQEKRELEQAHAAKVLWEHENEGTGERGIDTFLATSVNIANVAPTNSFITFKTTLKLTLSGCKFHGYSKTPYP